MPEINPIIVHHKSWGAHSNIYTDRYAIRCVIPSIPWKCTVSAFKLKKHKWPLITYSQFEKKTFTRFLVSALACCTSLPFWLVDVKYFLDEKEPCKSFLGIDCTYIYPIYIRPLASTHSYLLLHNALLGFKTLYFVRRSQARVPCTRLRPHPQSSDDGTEIFKCELKFAEGLFTCSHLLHAFK